MRTSIPGIKAVHAVITPNCRRGGAASAWDEAVRRLRREYEALLPLTANEAADFHAVLTVDRPDHTPAPGSEKESTEP